MNKRVLSLGVSAQLTGAVPFHGDQLFEERARNTQWVYQDGDNAYDRLEGLETEFADWHAKLNLYMVYRLLFTSFIFLFIDIYLVEYR